MVNPKTRALKCVSIPSFMVLLFFQFFCLSSSANTFAPEPIGEQDSHVLTYRWHTVPGATWYQLWIERTMPGGSVHEWNKWYQVGRDIYPRAGICEITLSGHYASARYNWWIRPWSPATGYGAWWPPVGTEPFPYGFNFHTTGGTRLQWSGVPGATWYRVWLEKDGMKHFDRWVERATSYKVLLPPGNYVLWIQPWSPETQYGSWIQERTFTISGPAPEPEPGEIIISDDARPITDETASFLDSISDDGSTYNFVGSTEQLESLSPGEIIVMG